MFEVRVINTKLNCNSFEEAFKKLYELLTDLLNNKKQQLSIQALDTIVWIHNNKTQEHFNFYQARDLAYKLNLMKDGKLVN